MSQQKKISQALFPDYPREPKIVNEKGELTDFWDLGLSSLFQGLQKYFKNEGLLLPSLNSTQINDIQTFYATLIGAPLPNLIPDISGQTVFDTDNRISKQFIITYDSSNNITSAQWLIINVMLLNAGNPNGVVVGALYWFCYDTTNKVLYICTATPTTWTVV